jgi:hypothetical protein
MRVQKLSKNRYVGDLCIHGHEYKDAVFEGGSLRYKGCNTCCVCNALSVAARKVEQEEYRNKPKNKKKMQKYQADYRAERKRATEMKFRGGSLKIAKTASKYKSCDFNKG